VAVKQGSSTIEMLLNDGESVFLVGPLAKKKRLDMEKERQDLNELVRKTRTHYEADYLRGIDLRWARHRKLYPAKGRGIRLEAARVACAARAQFGDSPMKIQIPKKRNTWGVSILNINEIEYFHRVLYDEFASGKIDRLAANGDFAKVFAIGPACHVEFTPAIRARLALTKAANTGDDEDTHLTCEIKALEVAVEASSSFLRNALKEREMSLEKINERSEPSI